MLRFQIPHFLSRVISVVAVLASLLAVLPGGAQAAAAPPVNLRYQGGPLLQHVDVVTLFWGPYWSSAPAEVSYCENFYQALFADGRFMANLAQYSAGGYQIGNGAWVGSDVDTTALPNPKQVTDAQIQNEIAAQIKAGALPKPDADTLYALFTPPGVVVVDPSGVRSNDPRNGFDAYHFYSRGSQGPSFAYSVTLARAYIDLEGVVTVARGNVTSAASHELAEAVTDPEVVSPSTLGWYDTNYGEVGDIVLSLYGPAFIIDMIWDQLVAPDGTHYWVQKEWSNRAIQAVAFAA